MSEFKRRELMESIDEQLGRQTEFMLVTHKDGAVSLCGNIDEKHMRMLCEHIVKNSRLETKEYVASPRGQA